MRFLLCLFLLIVISGCCGDGGGGTEEEIIPEETCPPEECPMMPEEEEEEEPMPPGMQEEEEEEEKPDYPDNVVPADDNRACPENWCAFPVTQGVNVTWLCIEPGTPAYLGVSCVPPGATGPPPDPCVGDDVILVTGEDWNENYTDGDDVICGNAENNFIRSGEGDDAIYGREGDDYIDSGPGRDRYVGGPGMDILFYPGTVLDTTSGLELSGYSVTVNLAQRTAVDEWGDSDTFSGIEIIQTGGGDDMITGTSGNDYIRSGEGDDTVNAGAGDDMIDPGSHSEDDSIDGGPGTDTLVCAITGGTPYELANYSNIENMESASDSSGVYLTGDDNDNVIIGDDGDNEIRGGGGNDRLFGKGGDDTIFGGAGDDYLDGGAGKKDLSGGPGADTYVIESGLAVAALAFEIKENADGTTYTAVDRICLKGFGDSPTWAFISADSEIQINGVAAIGFSDEELPMDAEDSEDIVLAQIVALKPVATDCE